MKSRFANKSESGFSVLEVMTGMVIFIAVSVGVTSLIVTSNQQVAESTETSYINSRITVASQLIGREISESTDIISVKSNEVVLEVGNGSSVVIKSSQMVDNANSACKLNITTYDATGQVVLEDSEVVDNLDSCEIFTESNNQVNFILQSKNSDGKLFSVSSIASTGYYSGTNDVGGFSTAAVLPAGTGLGAATKGVNSTTRNSITLSWDAEPSASNYVLQASTDGVGWYIVNSYILNTTFTASNLLPETRYYFRVAAQNAQGVGAWSSSYSAVTLAGSIPTAPIVSVQPSPTSLAVSWKAPTDNGGYPIFDYRIRYKEQGTATWIEASTSNSSTLTYSIFGLKNYTLYEIQVQALNLKGFSPAGSPATNPFRTSAVPPSIVQGLSAVPQNDGSSVILNWSLPVSNGGVVVLNYEVESRRSGTATWISNGSTASLTKTVTSLAKYLNYDFRVRATNPSGSSDWVTATALTKGTAPSSPILQAVTNVTPNSFTINWNAPTDTGGFNLPLSEYKVSLTLGASVVKEVTIPIVNNSYTFNELTRGTEYTYRVSAANTPNGYGNAATKNQTTLTTPPSAPVLSVGVWDNVSVGIKWSAPSNDGGSPVTGYNVYKGNEKVNSSPLPASSTSYTVGNLWQNTSYTFYVTALNDNTVEGPKQAIGLTVLTKPNLPCAPELVSLTSRTTNSISFSVAEGCGVYDAYKVYLNGVYKYTLAGSTGTLTELNPGESYSILVRATNETGDSAPSLLTASTSPEKVTNVRVEGNLNDLAQSTLKWDAPTGYASSYKVYAQKLGESTTTYVGQLTPINNQPLQLTVTPLLEYNTTYEFSISAISNGVEGDFALKFGTTVPAAVTNLTVTEVGSSYITLSWTPPTATNSPLLGYEFHVNGSIYTSTYSDAGMDDVNSFTLYDLASEYGGRIRSNTNHKIAIYPIGEGGRGARSTTSAKTLITIPTAPSWLSTESYDGTASVKMNWMTEGAAPDGFNIYAKLGDDPMTPFTLIENIPFENAFGEYILTKDKYDFQDLSMYTFGISATSNDGGESAITTAVAYTPNSVTYEGIAYEWTGNGSALITWDMTEGADYYKVYLNGGLYDQIASDATSYVLNNLNLTSSYTVAIKAVKQNPTTLAERQLMLREKYFVTPVAQVKNIFLAGDSVYAGFGDYFYTRARWNSPSVGGLAITGYYVVTRNGGEIIPAGQLYYDVLIRDSSSSGDFISVYAIASAVDGDYYSEPITIPVYVQAS
jgi:titin